MSLLWFLFFPVETPREDIQPSYKTMRARCMVMRQIETTKKLKLRKTYILETSYMNTVYRGTSIIKRARLSLTPLKLPARVAITIDPRCCN